MKRLLALIICIFIVCTTVLTSCNVSIPTVNPSDNIETTTRNTETTTRNTETTTRNTETTTRNTETTTRNTETTVINTEASTESSLETNTETTEKDSQEESKYKKSEVDFNSIEYVHYEFSTYQEYENEILELVENGVDFETLLEKVDELDEYFENIYTMKDLSEIIYYKNTTNNKNKEESDYTSELFKDVRYAFIKLLSSLFCNENYKDDFITEYGEEYINQVISLSEEMSDELVEMHKKIDKIVSDYFNLESTLKIEYNGSKFNIDGLIKRYQRGFITYSTLMSLIKKYYHEMAVQSSDLYLELISLYKQAANMLGYDDVIEYFYEKEYERDYGKEEVLSMYNYVKKYIVPLNKRLSALDPSDETQLNYWSSYTDLIDKYMSYIDEYTLEISADMAEAKEYMNKFNLMYRTKSDSAASVSFTTYIIPYDIPFVFIKENGGIEDIYTYIHEFGHFYSHYVSPYTDLNNLDIAEISSQANELLFAQKYITKITGKQFFVSQKLSNALEALIAGAMMDDFQRRVFSEENLTKEKIFKISREVLTEYNYSLPSYIALEDYWALVSHNFQVPFYYISYATSVFPAIELFEIGENDREKAIELYNKISTIEEEIEFLELLQNCGLRSPFEEEAYISIVNNLDKYKK